MLTQFNLQLPTGTELGQKKERLNDGNNNGQATHGARKPPGPI